MRSAARTGCRRVSSREGRSGAMHGDPVLRQQAAHATACVPARARRAQRGGGTRGARGDARGARGARAAGAHAVRRADVTRQPGAQP
eukprot:5877345-Prymnesium_polylepis.1